MTSKLLLDLPDQIETERLIIRAPRKGDGLKLNEAILESIDRLKPWLPWAKEIPTVEQSEEYCAQSETKFSEQEDFSMLLFDKETDELIGASGLHPRCWPARSFEIGYWCRKGRLRQGLIKESTLALCKLAFFDLAANRVFIRANSQNTGSWRIPESLGFTFEGCLRNDSLSPTGELQDTKVYAVTSFDELK